MVTDEMLKRAIEAYAKETGAEDWQLDGWINSAIRAVLEPALSAAEPVAWQPRYKQEVIDHHKSIGSDLCEYAMTVYPTKEQAQGYGYGGYECRALYAAPPAPSVVVKAWTAEDEAREYRSFSEWFKERGYPKYPEHYSLVCENAMHAAWQEAAKRSALSAQAQDMEGGL